MNENMFTKQGVRDLDNYTPTEHGERERSERLEKLQSILLRHAEGGDIEKLKDILYPSRVQGFDQMEYQGRESAFETSRMKMALVYRDLKQWAGVPFVGLDGSATENNEMWQVSIEPWARELDQMVDAIKRHEENPNSTEFDYEASEIPYLKQWVWDMQNHNRFALRFNYKDANDGEYKEAAFDYDPCINTVHLDKSGKTEDGEYWGGWQELHHPGFDADTVRSIQRSVQRDTPLPLAYVGHDMLRHHYSEFVKRAITEAALKHFDSQQN